MRFSGFLFFVFLLGCNRPETKKLIEQKETKKNSPSLIVLGTLQDGGSPHAGCTKNCCKNLFLNPDAKRMVVSLGIIDWSSEKYWLLEATPDISRQLKMLNQVSGFKHSEYPDGIFLTHAHIGHYSGLMFLGKEAMNAQNVNVYAMPRMKYFLEENGPWSQLVKLKNIQLNALKEDSAIQLSNKIKITPSVVPHRDEFSETVGYYFESQNKKVLFIPDIDKWEKWNRNIEAEIKKVDLAFIDGTFYDGNEINNRNIKEIPHPFVIESMERFKNLNAKEKAKIYFIHFNHTNPLLRADSKETKTVLDAGFNVAHVNDVIDF